MKELRLPDFTNSLHIYTVLYKVLFLDQVRSWCDNQEAPLNDYLLYRAFRI